MTEPSELAKRPAFGPAVSLPARAAKREGKIMDPNTALEWLRATTRMINGEFGPSDDEELARHAVTMAEHWQALDEWLKAGGFLPDAWKR